MTSVGYDPAAPGAELERRGIRLGDVLFQGVALAASVAATALLGLIAYQVFSDAWPAIEQFGLSFVWTEAWDPVKDTYGALTFVYGTVVTSIIALLLATPLSIAIALFLTEIAPRRVAAPIATLVELLAAVPSVVLGLWGILVFGPWVRDTLEPWLQSFLGWCPLFSGEPSQAGMLPAALVLTIMIIPITASLSRELFLAVPDELEEGALALGLTRWEMIRGVVLPYTRGGVVAAVILGLGRAVGEAIAVTQVIGGLLGIHVSLFQSGDTLASRIAAQYQGAATNIQVASLVYLALILLLISLITNFTAQLIVRRFDLQRTGVA